MTLGVIVACVFGLCFATWLGVLGLNAAILLGLIELE